MTNKLQETIELRPVETFDDNEPVSVDEAADANDKLQQMLHFVEAKERAFGAVKNAYPQRQTYELKLVVAEMEEELIQLKLTYQIQRIASSIGLNRLIEILEAVNTDV
jgi:hypothetical protein